MFLCLSGLGCCCGILIHCGRLLLRSGGLQSRLIHRGGCQLCSGGPRLHLLHHVHLLLRSGGLLSHLIHRGGCQLCFGDLQFHSGSMLHWLCFSPLPPHKQGLPTLHGLAYHPAPVPPSLHYSPVLFHGERLEAAPWGGAMSQLVSWLATRGRQTHTHHMDFILNSISHHAHWLHPHLFSKTWSLFKPFWPSILGPVLLYLSAYSTKFFPGC